MFKRSYIGAMIGVCVLSLSLYACSGFVGGAPGDDTLGLAMMPAGALGEIAYYQRGDESGRRVLFVHGTPGSASAWDEYLLSVPKGFHYLSYDRPGFGLSQPNRVMPGLADQAAGLQTLLPAIGKKAILVGHSLGGPIIAKAAADFPEQIGGLIIIAGSLDPGLEKIHPLQHVGKTWPISWLLPSSLDHSNREIFALESELEDLAKDLAGLEIPITIIHGTKDRLVPYENVAFMKERLSEANLSIITLEGKNHFLPWNAKDIIDNAILDLDLVLRDVR